MTPEEDLIVRLIHCAGNEASSLDLLRALKPRGFLMAEITMICDSLAMAGMIVKIGVRNEPLPTYRLTGDGLYHAQFVPPVTVNGTTEALQDALAVGVLLAFLQILDPDPAFGPVGITMVVSAVMLMAWQRYKEWQQEG